MGPAVDFSPRLGGAVRRAGAEKLAGPKRYGSGISRSVDPLRLHAEAAG
jgi:hypothetical protein